MAGIKALSQAGKLKAKRANRGRPFIQGVLREPNGRISRAIRVVEPADRLALEVRARQWGVDIQEARDPRLATYIGRLARLGSDDGGISQRQYRAALIFLEVRNNYQRAIVSPAAVYEERVGLSDGSDGLAQQEAAQRDVARFEAMMKAVQEAQFDNPTENLHAALQYLVIEDRQLPHMVGTLRLVLNVLARHFLLTGACHK